MERCDLLSHNEEVLDEEELPVDWTLKIEYLKKKKKKDYNKCFKLNTKHHLQEANRLANTDIISYIYSTFSLSYIFNKSEL